MAVAGWTCSRHLGDVTALIMWNGAATLSKKTRHGLPMVRMGSSRVVAWQ